MKWIKITIVLLLLQPAAFAQKDNKDADEKPTQEEMNKALRSKIGVAARKYKDSVLIRWTVSHPAVWAICKKNGFILQRATVGRNGAYGEFKSIGDAVFRPWSEEKWKSYLDSRPVPDTNEIDYDAFAYMFGASKENETIVLSAPTDNEIKDIKENKSKSEWQLLFVILSANSSRNAAEGLGLRFVDKNVKPGEVYIYRVFQAGVSPVYKIDTGYIKVPDSLYDPNFAKQKITADEEDRSVGISWKINDALTFCKVVRSDDNGRTFKKLTKTPLLTMGNSSGTKGKLQLFMDTTIVNYVPHTYRVYGTTSFADDALIGEIKAMGRDRTPPEMPVVSAPQHIANDEIKFTWKMNDRPAADLKGFNILRDTSSSGDFKQKINQTLLPAATREYTDRSFARDGRNFYRIAAIDTAGNVSLSQPVYLVLNDTTPPAAPRWMKATMDTNGIVKLVLHANREKDFMGYRIFMSNSPEHEFSSIIESFGNDAIDYSRDTIFYDTVSLNTTTRKVYYRATALDSRYNESQSSDIIAVPRPDIIPPITPMITDVYVTDISITLQIAQSTSEDVAEHIIYRKTDENDPWETIKRTGPIVTSLTDTNVKKGAIYYYSLRAKDSTGLYSQYANVMYGKPYDNGMRPPVENIKIDTAGKSVLLKWDYANMTSGTSFVIYKKDSKGHLIQYGRTNERSYTDRNAGKENSYAVKVMTNDGGQSVLSNMVSKRVD